jgi:flavin-dependent dehydrogenase
LPKKVCVAGAGPAGLLVAKELANLGMDVHLFEQAGEEENFAMHNWSDAVETDMLRDAGLPVPRSNGCYFEGPGVREDGEEGGLYEKHRIAQLAVFSPDYSERVTVDADFRHIFIDRQALRAYQTRQAREAGVKLCYGHRVTGLLGRLDGDLQDIRVTGLELDAAGKSLREEADLVVDASGQDAVLRCMLGNAHIAEPFDKSLYGYVFRTVRKFNAARVNESKIPFVEHYRLRSGKGYLFVHFHADDIVDIGCGVRDPLPARQAKETVLETVAQYPQIEDAQRRGGEGRNLKCLPPNSLVTNGFIVVGHAGAQMNPTQGCGIAASYSGALLAAHVIAGARDFDIESLWPYNARWFAGRGAHYAALFAKMRKIAALSERDIDDLLSNNIMNGHALTHDYHGLFVNLDTDETRRLENFRKTHAALADVWAASYAAGQRALDGYLAYPKRWNAQEFSDWAQSRASER